MAKYWVFQNNQVNGPYEAAELVQVAGFSLESLVCPEGRKGTNMGDWQRASIIPELSSVSTHPAKFAPSLKASEPARSSFALESASHDISQTLSSEGIPAGSTLEKISMLEIAVGRMHEQMQANNEDLLNLHRIMDNEKSIIAQGTQDLGAKIGSLEEKLSNSVNASANAGIEELLGQMKSMEEKISALSSLRENMEAAVTAHKDLEASVRNQAQSIEEMSKGLQELKDNLSSVPKPEPMASANIEPPQNEPFPQSQAFSMPATSSNTEPSQMEPFAQSQAFSMPAGAPEPGSQAGAPSFTLTEFPSTAEAPSPETSPMPSFPLASDALGSANEPAPSPAVTAIPEMTPSADLATKTKPKKGKPFLWLGGACVFVGALLAYEEGFIGSAPRTPTPVSSKSAQIPADNTQPAPNPAAAPVPTPPPVQDDSEALKKKAIQLVSTWPINGSKITIGAALAKAYPSKEDLNPWIAEKIIDGIYQIEFLAPKGGPYEFEAHLNENQVLAKNKLAQRLMSPPIRRRRRPRVKLKHKAPQTTAKAAKPATDKSLDNLLLPGFAGSQSASSQNAGGAAAQQEPPDANQQAAPAQAQPPQDGAKKASDAQLLDNLLKP